MISRLLRFASLITLICLITTLAYSAPASAADRDRDPLAPVTGMEVPQYDAFPPDILQPDQVDNIKRLVDEARLFGIPLSVRVITTPTGMQLLENASAVEDAAASPQQITEQLARDWMENEAIESSEGAEDGLLLFIIIPENDRAQTTAAFVGGENALPLNGVTGERLDGIVADTMQPFFANNSVAEGINQGIAMLSYMNLFAVAPRIEPDTNHERLQLAANLPLAVLTVGSTLGLFGLLAWVRNRRHGIDEPTDTRLSPFEAGAISRGRVDESVTTGALLHLIHTGVLITRTTRSGEFIVEAGSNTHVSDPFEETILEEMGTRQDRSGRITGASMRRLQDILMPAGRSLEDSLATRGLFHRDARVEHVWIILGSLVTAAVALFTLLPSILGMARYGVLAIVFAVIGIIVTLAWSARRSFATGHGTRARDAWLSASPSADDLATYDAIVNQDALLATEGGVILAQEERVVRTLRGMGTA